jgi:hypothetical protein
VYQRDTYRRSHCHRWHQRWREPVTLETSPAFHSPPRRRGAGAGCPWAGSRAPVGFKFSRLAVRPDCGGYRVSVDVTNTGNRTGADVAQLYVGDPAATGDAMTRKPVIAARLALAGVLASTVLASTAAITLPAVAVPANTALASTAPAAPAASAHPGPGLVVRTDRGLVEGMNAEGTDQFLGIQYAAPPAGALRWAAHNPHVRSAPAPLPPPGAPREGVPPARPPAGRASGRRRPTAAGAPSWPAATARGRTTRTASTSTCTRHRARTAAPPAPAMITGGCRCSS